MDKIEAIIDIKAKEEQVNTYISLSNNLLQITKYKNIYLHFWMHKTLQIYCVLHGWKRTKQQKENMCK